MIAAPTDPSPATMLNTPAGNPTSLRRPAKATVDSGVYSEHWEDEQVFEEVKTLQFGPQTKLNRELGERVSPGKPEFR